MSPPVTNILADTPALLLVGGLGTRLWEAVSDRPKAMALIDGKPFLEYQIEWLRVAGVRECILAIGYRGEMVRDYFGDGSAWKMRLIYSQEDRPLGTWGAIRLAGQWLRDRTFLVLNGDSWVPMQPCDLLQRHHAHRGCGTLTVSHTQDCARFGTVQFDPSQQIMAFLEKQNRVEAGWINAGVYAFSPAVFELAPSGASSLEIDILPRLVPHGLFAHPTVGNLIDIGLPSEYQRLNQSAADWRNAMRRSLEPRS